MPAERLERGRLRPGRDSDSIPFKRSISIIAICSLREVLLQFYGHDLWCITRDDSDTHCLTDFSSAKPHFVAVIIALRASRIPDGMRSTKI